MQVMQRRLKRVVEDLKAAVVAEVEALVCHGLPKQASGVAWSDLMQVLPSADLLLDELEVMCAPLLKCHPERPTETTAVFSSHVPNRSQDRWKRWTVSDETNVGPALVSLDLQVLTGNQGYVWSDDGV